ncbi:hypothetical protein [Roseivivax sp. THAF197b]|uniref:hypothetical protein n=1 Tax=Roseivivax sp. THAF197b TaxID=2588299 RepID=UPI00126853F8|nr:hypothetical protein [Roseivivax sp. THAF197b]QFS82353.1 hypothetical protein FIV09_05895 [Roseivivax sp. THAF197b]
MTHTCVSSGPAFMPAASYETLVAELLAAPATMCPSSAVKEALGERLNLWPDTILDDPEVDRLTPEDRHTAALLMIGAEVATGPKFRHAPTARRAILSALRHAAAALAPKAVTRLDECMVTIGDERPHRFAEQLGEQSGNARI